MEYFYTNDPAILEWLERAVNSAHEKGGIRIAVNGDNQLRFKVGSGMWSHLIPSDFDRNRDSN